MKKLPAVLMVILAGFDDCHSLCLQLGFFFPQFQGEYVYHPQIPFRLVVGKRFFFIRHKTQHVILIITQPFPGWN
jgi:hypothetical protein